MLEAIASRARSAAGRERVLAIRPHTRIEAARSAQEPCRDLIACREAGDAPPAAAPPDLAPVLERLGREGATLRGEELFAIARLLVEAGAFVTWHRRRRRETPGLDRLAGRLTPLEPLLRELTRALEPDGTLRDDASAELSRIRRSIRSAQDRLASRLESILRGIKSPDSFVTLREGRYVIALPSGLRQQVPGAILGHSGSGASVFVEPREAAEGNSELAEWAVEETREVARILRELSAAAHRDADAIQTNFDALSALDAAQAAAAWAEDSDATLPELTEERRLVIRGGRHPILVQRHRLGEMGPPCPLDLTLDSETPMLLVTGPNMGGKTVALKTAGLLSLLGLSGLPVPAAPGTQVPWFDRVICDIGDEQSIASDVSTFLSHLRRVTEALAESGPQSLVLLDELGSGTDPLEGAALGQAVLEALLRRRALCVATTHHGMLKTFAQETQGVRNASMEFDEATLRPLFRLVVGVPGGSRAIQVAERYGMEPEVLSRARDLLPRGERDLNQLLAEVGRLREEARAEREALASARVEIASRDAELAQARRRLEEERRERKQAELEARRDLLRKLEAQIDEYRRRLRTEKKASASTLEEARGLARGLEADIERESAAESAAAPEPAAAGARLRTAAPGDRVYVPSLRAEATVLRAPDGEGRVQVRIGHAAAWLPLADLRALGGPAGAAPSQRRPSPSGGHAASDEAEVKPEIDVRGFEADDAIRAVERFLEDAHMGGLPTARIIHGKGKGILRDRMKHWLKSNQLVKEFRLGEMGEGGTGVTIVTLAGE